MAFVKRVSGMRAPVRLRGAAAALCLALSTGASACVGGRSTPVTPEEHRRGEEQTFLTVPGVVPGAQPGRVRDFVKRQPPSEFPFFGHIGQFWSSYAAGLSRHARTGIRSTSATT